MSIWTPSIRTFAGVLAGSLMLAANAVADVTFTVNSVLDQIDDDTSDGVCHTAAGTCTLRAAVMSANKASGGDVTIVLPAGTYTLVRPVAGADGDDSGDLNLTAPTSGNPSITISGAGPDVTIIDANQIDRVLSVESSRTASISGVTLTNGLAPSDGGGITIAASASLTLINCTVSHNTTGSNGGGISNGASVLVLNATTLSDNSTLSLDGGGIFNEGGTVNANGCKLSANHAKGGGGIFSLSGSVTLDYCTLSGNTAGNPGGGISNSDQLTISHSTLDGNMTASDGGGIYTGPGAITTLSQSTISGNAAHGNGGGIFVFSSVLSVTNSTIALNNADTDGGGIYNFAGPDTNVNVYSSTISGNDADQDQDFAGSGGGVFLNGTGGNGFNLYNTILALNIVSNHQDYDDCTAADGGVLKTHARNLFGSGNGCTILQISGSYAALSDNSLAGPLQNNGGPTRTIALLAGSNAIDGTIAGEGCRDSQNVAIGVDQRGFVRGTDSACDVGAYEYDDIFANGFQPH